MSDRSTPAGTPRGTDLLRGRILRLGIVTSLAAAFLVGVFAQVATASHQVVGCHRTGSGSYQAIVTSPSAWDAGHGGHAEDYVLSTDDAFIEAFGNLSQSEQNAACAAGATTTTTAPETTTTTVPETTTTTVPETTTTTVPETTTTTTLPEPPTTTSTTTTTVPQTTTTTVVENPPSEPEQPEEPEAPPAEPVEGEPVFTG